MPQLRLGPLLRYVGETEATVWVETDVSCEVDILGRKETTWEVEGHHYALVYIKDLEPGTSTPYSVALDGETVWPLASAMFPHSTIRTPKAGEPTKMAFGSCRVSVPHEEPYSLTKDEDDEGREIDAVYAYVKRMIEIGEEQWPHLLLWLGDQVYADEVSPGTREFIRSRRDPEVPPGEQVADFEEYTHLYLDSWGDPAIRWVLSTVASAMIFDDHDVHDDWNTSQAWLDEYRSKPWWNERIVGALMSYWIYQHIGNLSPRDLQDDEMYEKVRQHDGDAGPMLREFAYRADREVEGTRWSYCRQMGETKLIVMDSRAGRVLEDGKREMLDEREWDYIRDEMAGDHNHLLLATSLPVLLAPGMHHLEAWNEAVCDGAWGKTFSKVGEWIRQELDLEHWPAFNNSFHRIMDLIREVGTGEHGKPPASIVMLSGDVHHAYLTEVAWPKGTDMKSNVYQAVCSPFRNPLDSGERRAIKATATAPARWLTGAMARSAGVPDPGVRWRYVESPTFDNQIATLDWEGRHARMRIEKSVPGDPDRPELETELDRTIA